MGEVAFIGGAASARSPFRGGSVCEVAFSVGHRPRGRLFGGAPFARSPFRRGTVCEVALSEGHRLRGRLFSGAPWALPFPSGGRCWTISIYGVWS